MRRALFKLHDLSQGERNLLWAHIIVAIFGFAFGIVIVMRLDPEAFFTRGVTLYESWMLFSGIIGPTIALRMFRSRIGSESIPDALIGAVMLTMVSPIISGSLALPIYGTMFGPFTLLLVFWVSPFTLLVWSISLLGIYFLLRVWQKERDSIFGPTPPKQSRLLSEIWRDIKIR